MHRGNANSLLKSEAISYMSEIVYQYNVLCMEDNLPEVKHEMIGLQHQLRAKVYVANSYSQALKLFSEIHFHLFILDIEIKGERSTGIQFAEMIRTNPDYICTPILFMSVHSHFSYRMLSRFQNSAFLKKPFSAEELILQSGVLLNIPPYVQRYYQAPIFTLCVSKQTQIELSTKLISYIEVNNKMLDIQYIDGRLEHFRCMSGTFKALIKQIESYPACNLRQIHRAIVVNIDQIRRVEIQKNAGLVWLFNDNKPKLLGISYRENIAEFLADMKGVDNV